MWAPNSLWVYMGILVSGLMRLGPENLYLNTMDARATTSTVARHVRACWVQVRHPWSHTRAS